ncbi:Holliday junction resolvase RuvX [bacterium]|nr:Holliday junction resolvase RuvX [bacterium]
MRKYKKYLGIDWGEKRIGLACADEEIKIATPWKVVGSLKELVETIREENVDEVVIGVPYKMHDIKASLYPKFEKFLLELKNNIDVDIKEVDERLSSKTADSFIGSKKQKASRDASSAMVILQQYLDSLH